MTSHASYADVYNIITHYNDKANNTAKVYVSTTWYIVAMDIDISL